MEMGAPPHTFSPKSNEVHTLALTADGRKLASASWEGNVEIWNASTEVGSQINRIGELRPKMIFSPDGRWLAIGGTYNIVRVWAGKTGQLVLKLEPDIADNEYLEILSMAFSDNSHLLAASYSSGICVWNTTTGALVWKSEECGEALSLSFSPDTLCLVSGSSDNTIKVWELPENINNTSNSRSAQGLYYSDGLHFAACYPAVKEIGIWTGTTETDLALNKFHKKDVCFICLSPDHRSLASTSRDGRITVWDTETGHQKQTFGYYRGRDSKITSLAFRGNSQLAAADLGIIDIWDTSDGRQKKRFEEECRYIELVTFSTGGQWLAYKLSDRGNILPRPKVRVRDTEKDRCFLVSFDDALVTMIDSLSFSADSQLLALASFGNIYLLDVTSRACTRRFGIDGVLSNIQVSFDSNLQRRLQTQFGFLDLIDQERNCVDAKDSEGGSIYGEDSEDDIEIRLGEKILRESVSLSGNGFSYDLKWVTQGQRKLFQIPFDYQADHLSSDMTPVIGGSTLIWISKRGRLLRMHFNV